MRRPASWVSRVEAFASVKNLIATLTEDDTMIHAKGITKEPDSPRVVEEQRNVSVDGFLFAAKHEPDGDFHLLVCGAAVFDPTQAMNMEVSGIPDNEFAEVLFAVRRSFLTQIHHKLGDRYTIYNPPIPVHITGSLFYDIDHRPGVVGPTKPVDLRPSTAWEIHPVTSFILR